MNMVGFLTLSLGIWSVAAAFQTDVYSAQEFISLINGSCTSTQTPCALGCCPFTDGVCCSDGFECCQQGQTCIPFIGVCLGIVSDEEKGVSLQSSKSTPVENLITDCPPGTTTCGPDRCCRYPSATCCSDGQHCCPNGFRCDLPHKRCIKTNPFDNRFPYYSKTASVPAAKAVKKSPYKACPGSDKICPIYSSCCITDNGQWGCCPNPSFSHSGVAVGGDCCLATFGLICCPGECNFFGCVHS